MVKKCETAPSLPGLEGQRRLARGTWFSAAIFSG